MVWLVYRRTKPQLPDPSDQPALEAPTHRIPTPHIRERVSRALDRPGWRPTSGLFGLGIVSKHASQNPDDQESHADVRCPCGPSGCRSREQSRQLSDVLPVSMLGTPILQHRLRTLRSPTRGPPARPRSKIFGTVYFRPPVRPKTGPRNDFCRCPGARAGCPARTGARAGLNSELKSRSLKGPAVCEKAWSLCCVRILCGANPEVRPTAKMFAHISSSNGQAYQAAASRKFCSAEQDWRDRAAATQKSVERRSSRLYQGQERSEA
jgi:hypothetical protein